MEKLIPGGWFITFEGPDGAGKSTHLRLLAPWLDEQGYKLVLTREPGGTPVADRIREALFASNDTNILGLTEAFLVNAARAQHVHELLLPSLEAGKLILCDRYADATLAYQGYGRGIDLSLLRQLIRIATDGLQPNLTIYLDLPVEVGLARKQAAHDKGEELNHLDRMETAFHHRVAAGYKELIAAEPARWRVINASGTIEAIQESIRELLTAELG